ncbi:MAG TPA: hypothetical protein VF669_06475 [Tepidisphaeraceae bacterium]|jgi:hypothetical protein
MFAFADDQFMGRPRTWIKVPARSMDPKTYGRVVCVVRHSKLDGIVLVHVKPFSRNSMRYRSSGMWALIEGTKVVKRLPYRGIKQIKKAPTNWANAVLSAYLAGQFIPIVDRIKPDEPPARAPQAVTVNSFLETLGRLPGPEWNPRFHRRLYELGVGHRLTSDRAVEEVLPVEPITDTCDLNNEESIPRRRRQLIDYGGQADLDELPPRLNFGPRNKRCRRYTRTLARAEKKLRP